MSDNPATPNSKTGSIVPETKAEGTADMHGGEGLADRNKRQQFSQADGLRLDREKVVRELPNGHCAGVARESDPQPARVFGMPWLTNGDEKK